ncbi:lipopolysaccharide biosynthesis protein [Catenovulum maritimum]|uniref:Polysaccharide biosynthesis protein C-terminal domain-containing protein n=1 Tax=Catenovulum maritimum TaxID=1513271 RepID=A0A0J8GUT7_9ALTE|nr:oligosaccharide flippase family protein [Catenovulum maritimum]KMT66530.1 hypothetical protein XM47_03055 [Catenovulum maritimum]
MNSLVQISLYFIAIASAKLVSIFMMPIVTDYLTPAEYGQLNLLVSFIAIAGLVLSMGIADTIYRFSAGQGLRGKISCIRTCMFFCLITSSLFTIILFVFSNYIILFFPVEISQWQFKFILINLVASTWLSIPYCYFRLTNKAKHFAVFNICQVLLQASGTLLALYLGYGVSGVVLSGAVASLIICLAVFISYRRLFVVRAALPSANMFKYMLAISVSSIFVYGLNGAENWVIATYLGAEALAGYFIAVQFALALSFSFEPFRMWWFARRFAVLKNKPQMAADCPVIGIQIVILLSILMAVLGPKLIQLLLPEDYHDAGIYLPLLCLAFILRSHSDLFNLGCFVKNNAKTVPLINAISASFFIIFSIVWVEELKVWAILIGVNLAYFIRSLLFYKLSQKKVWLNYARPVLVLNWLSIGLIILSLLSSSQYQVLYFSLSIGLYLILFAAYSGVKIFQVLNINRFLNKMNLA